MRIMRVSSKQNHWRNIMDKKTEQVAAELIAMFDAAVKAEDVTEMERIVGVVCTSPNRPFRAAVMRQIGIS